MPGGEYITEWCMAMGDFLNPMRPLEKTDDMSQDLICQLSPLLIKVTPSGV